MGNDVLLGFYEPKVFTASGAITAGMVLKVVANDIVAAAGAGADHVVGVALLDAASGAACVVVHGAWIKVPGGGLTAGPLMPAAAGTVAAFASSGTKCGVARNATEAFFY